MSVYYVNIPKLWQQFQLQVGHCPEWPNEWAATAVLHMQLPQWHITNLVKGSVMEGASTMIEEYHTCRHLARLLHEQLFTVFSLGKYAIFINIINHMI
jgi:hypothetical protein